MARNLATNTESSVDYCHEHNRVEPADADSEKRFGIRVSLPPGDPLTSLLSDDWERVHWYATEAERDRAYDDMAKRHVYYRHTDSPSQVLEKILR
ncbi:MAG: hypothetical protein R3192_08365 [Woeseiaceae bacterium]|nr:hypothetical protein [Woeseiaceae bacterium]